MRRLLLAELALLLLSSTLPQVTLGAGITVGADLPLCAQTCFLAAVDASGCEQGDSTCICDSQLFYEKVLPCVVVNSGCKYADVQNILGFAVAFCKRTVSSSSENPGRVRIQTSGSQPASSAAPAQSVETTHMYMPSPEPTSTPTEPALAPTLEPPLTASQTTSILHLAPVSIPAPESSHGVAHRPELASSTEPPQITTVEAATTLTSSFTRRSSSSVGVVEAQLSSAPAVTLSSEDSPTSAISELTSTARAPSSTDIAEPQGSKPQDPSSDVFVIQTANPRTGAVQSQVTDAPAEKSAPPAATADEQSSASASALHIFSQGSFDLFLLCLFVLFLVY
ncbi:hypothetical protein DRE_00246 [Drechslerella stenobrocha 248]|uniref:CFEM domain-containing protein n=1 Tax=Drechslerella stenobrocha 248 TaxID=1043628 RepID=W7HXK6_9PEZI|nr:hypothetical protein DRE_00246 [Drechslerella stenobrocha 248]